MAQNVGNRGGRNVSATGRIALLLLLVLLAVANSAFLYFFFWDQLIEGRLIGVMIFSVSASAHLLYLFLPWFARDLLTPLAYRTSGSSTRYIDPNQYDAGTGVSFLPSMMMTIGGALCVVAALFWVVDEDPFGWTKEKPIEPIISEANCRRVGGEIVVIDGRTICRIQKPVAGGTPSAEGAPAAPAEGAPASGN